MKELARKIHLWAGLLVVGMVLFYCLTGILLNHRRAFAYFLERTTTVTSTTQVDTAPVKELVSKLALSTGEPTAPSVVKLRSDGTVGLLYGSHGRVTYNFSADGLSMQRVQKYPRQPWFFLSRLHKVFKTSDGWLWLADLAAGGIILVTVCGLLLIRFKLAHLLVLTSGLLLVGLGMLVAG